MTYTSPHLSDQQFMPVKQLMKMHSTDAMMKAGDNAHPNATRMNKIAASKDAETLSQWTPQQRQSMEGAIRDQSVTPVNLNTDDKGTTWIGDGNHRIARAHAMGIKQLPVKHADADPLAGWGDL